MGTSTSRSSAVNEAKAMAAVHAVLDLFVPLYVKAFGIHVVRVAIDIRHAQDAATHRATVESRLLKPPVATLPLRCGYLFKRGVFNTKLKKRCVHWRLLPENRPRSDRTALLPAVQVLRGDE